MSNQKEYNQKAYLKATILDIVQPLERQVLYSAKILKNDGSRQIMDLLAQMIERIKDHVKHRDKWDREFIGYLGKIQKIIDNWNESKGENGDRNSSNAEESNGQSSTEIEETSMLLLVELLETIDPVFKFQDTDLQKIRTWLNQEAHHSPPKITQLEVGESLNNANQESSNQPTKNTQFKDVESPNNVNQLVEHPIDIEERLRGLKTDKLRNCLHSLSIFPENEELKKRLVVYYWIGLGLISSGENENKTAEQLGEELFSELVKEEDIFEEVHARKHNQIVDRCTIKSTVHKQLNRFVRNVKANDDGTWNFYGHDGTNVKDKKDFRSNVKALLNLDIKYLNSSDIISNMDQMQNSIQVIQLGRWHSTNTAANERNSKDHIEVDETNFLNKLGQKSTYLSLANISGITELPQAIGKLEKLKILDLRSCHNLERLPQKPMSIWSKFVAWAYPKKRWLKELTHLDVSECHLLDYMPKWIRELSNLEVLKGFVVDSVGKTKQSCQLSDLSNLKKLRKLSIKVSDIHFNLTDLNGLKSLDNVLALTIIWSIDDPKDQSSARECSESTQIGGQQTKVENETQTVQNNDSSIIFPKNLKKLDIRCYPNAEAPELFNSASLPKLKRLYIRGGKLTKIREDCRWEVLEILRLRFLKEFDIDWYQLSSVFPKLECVEYENCSRLRNFPKNRSPWITKHTHDGPLPSGQYQFNDDEEIVLAPYSVYLTVEQTVTGNKTEPLVESNRNMVLQLTCNDLNDTQVGLDLVLVLDKSSSMKGYKLAAMKTRVSRLLNYIRKTDRVSIVTFDTNAKRQHGLCCITESFRNDIENLMNSLEANGDCNPFDGLQMGLKVLKDRRLSGKRASGIILMSSGTQTIHFGDAAKIDVPVCTIFLLSIYDDTTLTVLDTANKSMRRAFSNASYCESLGADLCDMVGFLRESPPCCY